MALENLLGEKRTFFSLQAVTGIELQYYQLWIVGDVHLCEVVHCRVAKELEVEPVGLQQRGDCPVRDARPEPTRWCRIILCCKTLYDPTGQEVINNRYVHKEGGAFLLIYFESSLRYNTKMSEVQDFSSCFAVSSATFCGNLQHSPR